MHHTGIVTFGTFCSHPGERKTSARSCEGHGFGNTFMKWTMFYISFSRESVCGRNTGETMKWFFILSGLIACTGNPSTCPLVMNPPSIVVKFQDPFTVNCSSQADNIDSMGWEAQYGEGIGLTKGVSSVPLEVKSVTTWNMLDPQCYINLDGGSQCLVSLSVTIYKMPDRVSIATQMGPMEEGGKYNLKCDIANVAPARNLSVHWLKGNEIIHTETFDKSSLDPVSVSSLYTLTPKRGDNGSPIRCEAELNFSPPVPYLPTMLSEAEDLIVLYPPTFTKPENETLVLSARTKVILNCTAAGNPMPVYSWHFPHKIQQTPKNKNENQPILNTTIDLPGTYNCTAYNARGSMTKYFNVVEAPRNRTTLAAIIGVFVAVGVLLFIGGLLFVTPDGTFSFSKGSYLQGRPASGPV